MFTGLVKSLGKVESIKEQNSSLRVSLVSTEPDFQSIEQGESISINGVCLTALDESSSGLLTVDISPETISKTNLDLLRVGDDCNLEKAVRLSDRMGGHLVQGHVDSTGQVTRIRQLGDFYEVGISFEEKWNSLVIDKGSIAIDGVSLTINSIQETRSSTEISLMIIPHTWSHTRFRSYQQGESVNIEFDQVAKYVAKNFELKKEAHGK